MPAPRPVVRKKPMVAWAIAIGSRACVSGAHFWRQRILHPPIAIANSLQRFRFSWVWAPIPHNRPYMIAAWHDLPDAERRARLRALQALVRILAGPAGRELVSVLRQAEANTAALPAADAEIDALPTVTRRRILSTFLETLPASAQ